VALLARKIIMTIAGIIAMIIATGILAVVLEADRQNSVVSTVLDVAEALVGPFDGIFTPKDPKVAIAINWGIAIVVYLVVGRILAALLRRFDRGPDSGRSRARGA